MARKSKLSARQRQEVVRMRLRREKPAAALARRYGVSENTLYKWREQFLYGRRVRSRVADQVARVYAVPHRPLRIGRWPGGAGSTDTRRSRSNSKR